MKEVDKRVSRKLKDREREQASLVKKRKHATQQTQVLKYKCSRFCIIPENLLLLDWYCHTTCFVTTWCSLPFFYGPKHLRPLVANSILASNNTFSVLNKSIRVIKRAGDFAELVNSSSRHTVFPSYYN